MKPSSPCKAKVNVFKNEYWCQDVLHLKAVPGGGQAEAAFKALKQAVRQKKLLQAADSRDESENCDCGGKDVKKNGVMGVKSPSRWWRENQIVPRSVLDGSVRLTHPPVGPCTR